MSCVAALVAILLGLGTSAGCGGFETGAERPPQPPVLAERPPRPPVVAERPPQPPVVAERPPQPPVLAGRTIVIDPGHQLGNHNFPDEINRPVPAGGFTKPCNTTGTATTRGYPEATFVWRVSLRLKAKLEKLGARVVLTRKVNSEKRWGPCVDRRGRAGNKIPADLKISVHGDGSYAAGARGFHVIAPTDRAPWTDDIFKPSRRLARLARASLLKADVPAANYIAGGDGLDFRSDLGTLNLSDVPTVMVELGNMKNADDAGLMTTAKGRAVYAAALARAARRFLL